MYKTLPVLYLIWTILLPAGPAQTVHCDLTGDDYDSWLYDVYRYPYDRHDYRVRIFEMPYKPHPKIIHPEKTALSADPLTACFARRMEAIITATNWVGTDTVRFDMAPGLSPAGK